MIESIVKYKISYVKYFHNVKFFFFFLSIFSIFFFSFSLFFYKKQIISDVKIQFPFEERKKNIWPETFFFLILIYITYIELK